MKGDRLRPRGEESPIAGQGAACRLHRRMRLWYQCRKARSNAPHRNRETAMLSIHDRTSRRAFLQIGSLALGGLSLPALLAARAAAAEAKRLVTDKSVIFLFLHGGPSQTETFDPKMTAGPESRSATGQVATSLPGVTFGGTFPKLAALAHKLA